MKLDFDLENRVRNVSLAPTTGNALLPIFEAASNALHAIESRFRRRRIASGRIVIDVDGDEKKRGSISSIVSDNGTGLDAANWRSFLTSDSPHKLRKGGKGVGRLLWLKVFSSAAVKSIYSEGDGKRRRTFEFFLDNTDPIRQPRDIAVDSEHPRGTSVSLYRMLPEFEAVFPTKAEAIATKLASHFLPQLISPDHPEIELNCYGQTIPIHQLVQSSILSQKQQSIRVQLANGSTQQLLITHILLKKILRISNREVNWAYYGGNNRVVYTRCLDAQLGLKLLGDRRDRFYVAYVTGDLLDGAVTTERTSFTIDPADFEAVHRAVRDAAIRHLKMHVDQVRTRQAAIVSKIIEEFPILKSAAPDVDDFVNRRLSLNAQKEEAIFLELQRYGLRRSREVEKDLEAINGPRLDGVSKAAISEIKRVAADLEQRTENALAEYVKLKHRLLDLLARRTQQASLKAGKYFKEEDVHELIIPLRSTSSSLSVNEGNIWIIDDKLPFFKYFASDVQLRKIFAGLSSRRRPDAILFDEVFGFRGTNGFDPVVLIEFKRPGRTSYDRRDNPVSQIVDYVVDINKGAKNLVDGKGAVISPFGKHAWFHAYVIADLTKELASVLDRDVSGIIPTHDGWGRLAIFPQHSLFVQVISYRLLLRHSVLRNKPFFDKLKLPDIDVE